MNFRSLLPDAILRRLYSMLPTTVQKFAGGIVVVLAWAVFVQGLVGLVSDTKLVDIIAEYLTTHAPPFVRRLSQLVGNVLEVWLLWWRSWTDWIAYYLNLWWGWNLPPWYLDLVITTVWTVRFSIQLLMQDYRLSLLPKELTVVHSLTLFLAINDIEQQITVDAEDRIVLSKVIHNEVGMPAYLEEKLEYLRHVMESQDFPTLWSKWLPIFKDQSRGNTYSAPKKALPPDAVARSLWSKLLSYNFANFTFTKSKLRIFLGRQIAFYSETSNRTRLILDELRLLVDSVGDDALPSMRREMIRSLAFGCIVFAFLSAFLGYDLYLYFLKGAP